MRFWAKIIIFLFGLAGAAWAGETPPADGGVYGEIVISTPAPHNPRVLFRYRAPARAVTEKSAVIVMFGGRNWPAARALSAYGFNGLADAHNAVLLAPSFTDDGYWQPEAWSGAALLAALAELEKRLGLRTPPLYYYGYSAGAQCAALFYFWRPERVRGVALHACGVYPELKAPRSAAPWLITCGEKDAGRFTLSYTFTQKLRENGAAVVFRNYPGGHELSPAALRLARAVLGEWLVGEKPALAAEDFRPAVYPFGQARLDPEVANCFARAETAALWRGE